MVWDRFPPGLLVRAARGLGAGLLAILERLARQPARHGAGLPDLLAWVDGRVLLAEVKGPGDQPSVEQRLWHAWLLAHGVPFSLIRVRRVVSDGTA
ncbi:MAG: VRR-NUC domain-containing protein [bacterium]